MELINYHKRQELVQVGSFVYVLDTDFCDISVFSTLWLLYKRASLNGLAILVKLLSRLTFSIDSPSVWIDVRQ